MGESFKHANPAADSLMEACQVIFLIGRVNTVIETRSRQSCHLLKTAIEARMRQYGTATSGAALTIQIFSCVAASALKLADSNLKSPQPWARRPETSAWPRRPPRHPSATVAWASVNEFAEPFEMTLAAVSKHIRVLETAGLVTRGRQAQSRPCKLEAGPMRDVASLIDFYRRFWEQNLDQLDAYVKALQTPEAKTKN